MVDVGGWMKGDGVSCRRPVGGAVGGGVVQLPHPGKQSWRWGVAAGGAG